jgi:hypothetical protein
MGSIADCALACTDTDDIEKMKPMHMPAFLKVLFNRLIIFLLGQQESAVLILLCQRVYICKIDT